MGNHVCIQVLCDARVRVDLIPDSYYEVEAGDWRIIKKVIELLFK